MFSRFSNADIVTRSSGRLVAHLLHRAWRTDPNAFDISAAELGKVSSLLLGSAAGGLAWNRVRGSELRSCPAACELQQAYRKHTIEAALHESHIKLSLRLLQQAGIEPTLVKGWSVARLYPEKGLRPYDDLDLVVPVEQYDAAETIIKNAGDLTGFVDLHKGYSELDHLTENALFRRSQLARLGDVDVRVLSSEDSLRILCLHLLRHGAFRPLWLCDIGVAVESRTSNFDWDRCLSANKRVADWVACTIGLAHQLLGARVDDTPVKRRAKNLPRWLIPSVLKQWERPFSRDHGVARHRAPMASYLRTSAGLLRDIRTRWPNPIEATVYLNGPFNQLPRWPFQVGECIGRTANFIARLPNSF